MDNVENEPPLHEARNNFQDEGPITVNQPFTDRYFTANELIIRDLLSDQLRYHSLPAYCVYELPAQAIWMRRALLNWLREVCEHRNSEPEVLAHTAQLIDRFLQRVQTDKREYQLVGAACFLISSKLKETVPVSVERMVQYTDFSVTKQEIMTKEIAICISLKWDLTSISPIDFIKPTVDFIQYPHELQLLIRKSAVNIFMKILHVEGINLYEPAYTAAVCILYAMQLTITPDVAEFAVNSASRISRLLGLKALKLREVFQFLLALFKPGTAELSDFVLRVDQGPVLSSNFESSHKSQELSDLECCSLGVPLS